VHDEYSVGVQFDALGTIDFETDPVRIGAGRDDEVVLEPAGSRVVHEIDAGIDVDIVHATVRGRADGRRRRQTDVVDDARQLLVSRDPGRGIGADGLHTDGGIGPEPQNHFGGSQERRVSRAARHELHLRVGLAAVGFENGRTVRQASRTLWACRTRRGSGPTERRGGQQHRHARKT
jgi:hypothetical protein